VEREAEENLSPGKQKEAVKKLIKTVWIREVEIELCPVSEEMAELVSTKLKKKAGKCIVVEPEAASKTNNALLKAVAKAHLWKRQLKEGKHATVRELSTTVNNGLFISP
jgi:site-specific DNA recombinase